MNKKSQNFWTG